MHKHRFHFYMFWYPQTPLLEFQVCRTFFLLDNMPFREMSFFTIGVNTYCFQLFSTTPNRRGTQFHANKQLNFVLSSHPDLIGYQNDVQLSTHTHHVYFEGKYDAPLCLPGSLLRRPRNGMGWGGCNPLTAYLYIGYEMSDILFNT